jgi:hypothetical protein
MICKYSLHLQCKYNHNVDSVITAFLFSPVVMEDEMGECVAWIQEKSNSCKVLVWKPEAETTWKN